MNCAQCGHAESAHGQSLFGIQCRGREWHDQGSYQCGCTAFVPAATAEQEKSQEC
jgi:hypothetical protein